MPSPTSSLATQRPDLAESFMEFDLEMDRRGFIAAEVYPVAEVAKQAGNFGKIPLEQLLQQRDTQRAPGSGYARGNWTFDPATYATEEHGAEEPIDDREATMYREYFDAEQVSAMRAFDVVLRNAEQRVADAVFDAATWTGAALTTAVVNEWDDVANATPRADVSAASQKVWENSGLWPNALIINRLVFNHLLDVTEIVDRLKYSGHTDPKPGNITRQAMAQALGIERLIISGSAKNTANEGAAASLAPVWSNEYAMVCRVARGRDFREPCIGRTFHWSEDGSEIGGMVETYRDETIRGDVARVRHDVDEIVLYVEAGHLLSNITT